MPATYLQLSTFQVTEAALLILINGAVSLSRGIIGFAGN
jgi:hypothetical protein